MIFSNARSLALLGAYMANKGTFNGKQLLSEQTWEKFHSEPNSRRSNLGHTMTYSKGGCCHFGSPEDRDQECPKYLQGLVDCLH